MIMDDGYMTSRGFIPIKARRIMQTDRVIAKRLRLLREIYAERSEFYQQFANQPHRLAKKHPLDCGQSQCFWCHMEKLNGIPSYRDRRASSR